MGMFDYMMVDVNILPDVSSMEKVRLKLENFQTKDFDCSLSNISIVENTKIYKRRRGFMPYKLQIAVPDASLKDLDFTGPFTFYTSCCDDWYEFIGVAIHGRLTSLSKIKTLKDIRDDKINQILK